MLKPGGFIGNPPMDLVIVLHMARSWVQDNQVFSKHANVYFHYQQQYVFRKKPPYFQANLLASFLMRSCRFGEENTDFIQPNLGII